MTNQSLSFVFDAYKFEPKKKRLTFKYAIYFRNRKSLRFTETIKLPKAPRLDKIPRKLLNNLLDGLHLILGINYYKLYCPPAIKLNGLTLSRGQADFWNTVYRKGLGELCYRSNTNPKRLAVFPFEDVQPISARLPLNDKILVGIGGGKDSIVVSELLKEQKQDVTALVVETQRPSSLINRLLSKLKMKPVKIRRMLDKKILDSYPYKGHIPVSAVYAWLGALAAVLYNYSYIAMGNEYSSNFGNVKFKGEDINHQWSKSSEFEHLFQQYLKKYISPDIVYFSALRPFYEIRVVKMFSKYKKYFPYFSSCNRNFRIKRRGMRGLWCGQCPKCVFVFILLSAFLSKKDLLKIFKKNLYQDQTLQSVFEDVLGLGNMKPFDCVGTFQEAQAALCLAAKKFKNDAVIKALLPKVKLRKRALTEVLRTQPAPDIPVRFKFLGLNNVLILGSRGIEGQASRRYLRKKHPRLKLGLADAKQGPSYLDKQAAYDLAIRNPGLSKEKVTIPHTTATNIFLANVKNPVIGVTGSKGKSTTAALITALLKEGGRRVRLLGNIGTPMLAALTKRVASDEIFVLELSSFQLDDIAFSPHIAVVTALFPEHMDYHGGVGRYYRAKKNIISFQKEGDIFVFNRHDKRLAGWAKEARATVIPADSQGINLDRLNVSLLGEHNRQNMESAITAAKLFDISDRNIRRGLEKFRPLPHRLECVGCFRDIIFYDDAISTAPESTIAAIKALSQGQKIGTIFLGGQDRGFDFQSLTKLIRAQAIRNIVLFPKSGRRILRSKKGLNVLTTRSMREAVKFAYTHTPKGEICLLSTASPSYTLWKNFEAQGNEFKKFIKKFAH